MSERGIQVSYQLCFEDYREALGLKKSFWRRWSAASGWIVLCVVIVAAIVVIDGDGNANTPQQLPSGVALRIRFLLASALSLFVVIVIGVLMVAGALIRPRAPWAAACPRKLSVIWIFPCALIGIGVAFAIDRWHAVRLDQTPTDYEVTLSFMPLATCFTMVALNWLFVRDRNVWSSWNRQVFLHRPYSLQADETGIELSEPMSNQHYKWGYLVGYRETANLLLLYSSTLTPWAIPKRAFSGDQLNSFKALIANNIPEGQFLTETQGFQVLPTAQQADSSR